MSIDRVGGRTPNQIRPLSCEQGLLNRCDGSVRYSQDLTSVIVGVFGPIEAGAKEELIDRATIQVNFQPAIAQSGAALDIQRELQLARALAPIIITSLAPRCAVQIEVQVVQEDGALFAAALNAACLALLNAGVACVAPVAAVTVAVLADGTLLIDPDAREEKAASACVTLAFASHSKDIVFSDTRGVMNEDVYFTCVELAAKACTKIHNFYRLSIEKRSQKGI